MHTDMLDAQTSSLVSLDSVILTELVTPSTTRLYMPGMEIARQGDPCTHVYVIKSGTAKLFHCSPDGHVVTVAFLGPTSVVGSADALLGLPFTDSAVALERCVVLRLSADIFVESVLQSPDGLADLARYFAALIRTLSSRVEVLASCSAAERVLLAIQGISADALGRITFQDTELAQLVGVTPQYLSRVLHGLQRRGVIWHDGRRWNVATDISV